MSSEFVSTAPAPAADPLRRKIGGLCQSVRFIALGYAGWVGFSVASLWLDKAEVARRYGGWLKVDLSGIEGWQRVAGFSLHAITFVLVAAACWSAWKLFSGYLEGRIFTLDAAHWLRRIGTFGLAAELSDIAFRPLVIATVTAHMPKGQRHIGIALNQNDLAFLMFLFALIALAHIFTKAAEIAAENEGIV